MNISNILINMKNWMMDSGLQIILIIIFGYIAHLILKRLVIKVVKKMVVLREEDDITAEEKRENTLINIVHGTLHIILVILTSFVILSELGINIAPLIAGAGVIGLAVGFGGQYLVKDLITGLFIILENQFRVGDVISISHASGVVENITLRKTILRDLDGVVYHIPNGEISIILNKTQGSSKINLNIGVAYNTDINKLIEVINSVGEEMFSDKQLGSDLLEKPYFLRVDKLGDSSIEVKILAEVRPGTQWMLTGELRKRLLERFRTEHIEIPFPQLVIHKN